MYIYLYICLYIYIYIRFIACALFVVIHFMHVKQHVPEPYIIYA